MLNYICTLKKFEKVKNNAGKNEVLKSCTQKLKVKAEIDAKQTIQMPNRLLRIKSFTNQYFTMQMAQFC